MVLQLMPYKILASGLSDVGLVRENNEDIWAELPDEKFYVLADGMGGHQAGEIASQEAVFNFLEIIRKITVSSQRKLNLKETMSAIKQSIEEVNKTIYEMGRSDEQLGGMGTTLCCVHFHPEGVILAHVGDSRIYRFGKGGLKQLTKDHSLMSELVEMGYLSEPEAKEFLYKNILTRAIGTEPSIQPTVESCQAEPGDLFIMCSDGLSDLLTIQDIENVVKESTTIDDCAQTLVSEAKRKGGYDNITVVLLKVSDDDDTKGNISR